MINEYERLNHSVWECKYHVVFIPKYRRKALFGAIKKELGVIFKDLARQKESTIEEGHVHMLISIPPKYSVASVIGFIKGKSAIQIARRFRGKERNFTGEHFWARGYFVSTVGRDEVRVREYIKNQEKEDVRHEQLQLFR